ncbi:MAG: extracellular solute-binding protein [Nitrososphaeria archaeon]
MSQEPKKVGRRTFLNYAIAIIATGVIVGAATYFAIPKGEVTVTKTVTTTITGTPMTTTPTTTIPAGKVYVEFWTELVEEPRMEVLNRAAQAFMKENPDIEVKVVPVVEAEYPTKLTSAYMSGKMPQVMEVATYFMPEWLSELDADAITDVINEIGEDQFVYPLKIWQIPGEKKWYAASWIPWIAQLYYRKDWFEEVGLEKPKGVMTWDQILQSAEKLNNPPNRYGIFFDNAKGEIGANQIYFSMGFANNVRLLDEDLNIRFDDPESIEVLEFLQKLSKFTPPGPDEDKNLWTLFPQYPGTISMCMANTYMPFRIYNTAKDLIPRTEIISRIKNKVEGTFGEDYALGIFKTNSTPAQIEASKKWCKFLLTSKYYAELCGLVVFGLFPVVKSVTFSDEYLNNPIVQAFGGRQMVESLIEGFKKMQVPAYAEGRGIVREFGPPWSKFLIAQAVYEVCNENASPKETAVKYAEKMREAIKEMKK